MTSGAHGIATGDFPDHDFKFSGDQHGIMTTREHTITSIFGHVAETLRAVSQSSTVYSAGPRKKIVKGASRERIEKLARCSDAYFSGQHCAHH